MFPGYSPTSLKPSRISDLEKSPPRLFNTDTYLFSNQAILNVSYTFVVKNLTVYASHPHWDRV